MAAEADRLDAHAFDRTTKHKTNLTHTGLLMEEVDRQDPVLTLMANSLCQVGREGYDAQVSAVFGNSLNLKKIPAVQGQVVNMTRISFAAGFLAAVLVPIVTFGETPKVTFVRTMEGHSKVHGLVRTVPFSPDSRYLASVSQDKTIKLWNVETGGEVRTFEGHTSDANWVEFSPDGRLLASGSDDNTVRIWDVNTGHEIRVFNGHTDQVQAVTFIRHGKFVASSSKDKTIRVWDIQAGKEFRTLTDHTDAVFALAASSDGRWLASGSDDKTVKLWDVNSLQAVKTLTGPSNIIRAIAFNPNGHLLAAASRDPAITVWNVATGRVLRTMAGPTDEPTGVTFTTDGRFVIASSRAKTLRFWNVKTGKQVLTLKLEGGSDSVEVSPDGKWLAAASANTVSIWKFDPQAGQLSKSVNPRPIPDNQVLSGTGRCLGRSRAHIEKPFWDFGNV